MARQKISLDNTLRYLSNGIRLHGGTLVAIEFFHRGKRWRADTPEEAVALRKKLDIEEHNAAALGALDMDDYYRALGKWTSDRVWELAEKIGEQQKKLLQILYRSEEAIEVNDLVKRLRLDSPFSLAGVISGLSKQLRRMEIEPSDLYRDVIDWTEGERTRYIALDGSFKVAVKDSGWLDTK